MIDHLCAKRLVRWEYARADRRVSMAGLTDEGWEVKRKKICTGLLNTIMQTYPRTKARKDMGEKFGDESPCTKCGAFEKVCPYNTIKLDPRPVFPNSMVCPNFVG